MRRRITALLIVVGFMLVTAAPAFADPIGTRGHCTDNPDGSYTCSGGAGFRGEGGGGGRSTYILVPDDPDDPQEIEVRLLSRSGGSGGPGGGGGGHCTTNADTGELECVGGSGGNF